MEEEENQRRERKVRTEAKRGDETYSFECWRRWFHRQRRRGRGTFLCKRGVEWKEAFSSVPTVEEKEGRSDFSGDEPGSVFFFRLDSRT